MDKFLEMYNLLRLNWEKQKRMNGEITRIDTESVIKNLPKGSFQFKMTQ